MNMYMTLSTLQQCLRYCHWSPVKYTWRDKDAPPHFKPQNITNELINDNNELNENINTLTSLVIYNEYSLMSY